MIIITLALTYLTTAIVYRECTKPGKFALTFDDGPAEYTPQLLKHLKDANVKATFHLSTQNLLDPSVQSMVKRINRDGHLIGVRTEPNWDLAKMNEDQIGSAVARQSDVMASFIGYFPVLVRLPYGKSTGKVKEAIEKAGGIITIHNLESYDYTNDLNRIKNSFNVALGLKSSKSASFISLQHDANKASIDAVPSIISAIKGAGYELVTLDDCIGKGNLRENKTAMKGGKDAGPIPTVEGGNDDIPDAKPDGSSDGDEGDKKVVGLSGAERAVNVLSQSILGMTLLAMVLVL